MNPRTAQILGGLAGALAVLTWIVARQLGPPPCSGGVFVELTPPLARPGVYRFELGLDGATPCAFDVPLPATQTVDTSACQLELALTTRAAAGEVAIVGLAIGAAPRQLHLAVRYQGELAVDVAVEPEYSEYLAPRDEGQSFCGRRAFLRPSCVIGSAQCRPFPARCDGPEDCGRGEVCCASVAWAEERGADAATACLSARRCRDRYAEIACHRDADCRPSERCDSAVVRGDFRPELAVCRSRPGR